MPKCSAMNWSSSGVKPRSPASLRDADDWLQPMIVASSDPDTSWKPRMALTTFALAWSVNESATGNEYMPKLGKSNH